MKVLKKGREQRGWSKELVCTGKGNNGGGCGAVLLVEQGDLLRTGRHPYDGSHEYFVTFVCPECGVMTDVDGYPGNIRDLPAGIGGEIV